MEQVIAYKAFNGRLFDTEDKCIAYEKKMSQFPKVKEIVTKALPHYIVGGTYKDTDILCYTIETREKPNANKRVERYYIVGGKYKFIDLYNKHYVSVMGSFIFPNGRVSMNWYLAFRHFAEQILLGNELSDDFVKKEVDAMNDINQIKLDVKVIERNKKWEIDNPSWKSGVVAPYTFTIEKIR